MGQKAGDDGNGELEKAVRLRRRREERWALVGERSLWQNVSMIGALGWLIVTPTLLGVVIGRWLDVTFESGIFWSGTMIMLGAGFGGYLAWQRIEKG